MDTILVQFQARLSTLCLKPSSGGRFEVTVDDQLVYSALANEYRLPEQEELARLIRQRIEG